MFLQGLLGLCCLLSVQKQAGGLIGYAELSLDVNAWYAWCPSMDMHPIRGKFPPCANPVFLGLAPDPQ